MRLNVSGIQRSSLRPVEAHAPNVWMGLLSAMSPPKAA